jgi:hypothetical protein
MFEKTRMKNYSANLNIYLVKNSALWVETYGAFKTTYSLFAERGNEQEYWDFVFFAWKSGMSYDLAGKLVAVALVEKLPIEEVINRVERGLRQNEHA